MTTMAEIAYDESGNLVKEAKAFLLSDHIFQRDLKNAENIHKCKCDMPALIGHEDAPDRFPKGYCRCLNCGVLFSEK